MINSPAFVYHGVKIAVVACSLLCVAIFVGEISFREERDDSYYDRALAETGLDISQMSAYIEHKFCKGGWVDATVYMKLKVRECDASHITRRLCRFPRYKAEVDISPMPSWWKPSLKATTIVYCINRESMSPVILVCIDPYKNECDIYVAVIPV